MEKITKLKQQDRSLWQKLKDFISDMAKKIREIYKGVAPESREAQELLEAGDAIQKLADMFAEGLVEAGENFEAYVKKRGQKDAKLSARDGVPITESGRVESSESPLQETENEKRVKFSSRNEVLNRNDVGWMDDFSSIKDQLHKHRAEISKLQLVAIVNYGGEDKQDLKRLISEQVKNVGGERFARDGLSFSFDATAVQSIVLHARSPELRAAALAAPYVAKRGVLIAGQKKS